MPVPELTGNHHRQVGLHEAGQHPVNFLHGGRTANQRNAFEFVVFRVRRPRLLWLRQSAANDCNQLLEIKRFRQVLIGPALGGTNCRHESVLRTHHDDWQIGSRLSDARNQIEGILVRHDDIRDHQVAVALGDPAP